MWQCQFGLLTEIGHQPALPDLSQISVPSYEASRYATEALVHCKVNRALRTRAELMHGT
jgi:hypothetical protein